MMMRKNFEDVLKMFNPKNATEMIIGYNSDNNIKTHDMFRDSHIVIGGHCWFRERSCDTTNGNKYYV